MNDGKASGFKSSRLGRLGFGENRKPLPMARTPPSDSGTVGILSLHL